MRMLLAAAVAAAGLAAGLASAASVESHTALALGAIVGGVSPMVGLTDRATLAALLDGKPTKWRKIVVKSDAVVCRAGNVDITTFRCDLTFGTKRVSLQGRHAHELFATILEAGMPGEGAAGTIYEALHNLSCTIDPPTIAQNSGAGADCTFDPGPS